MLDGDRLEELRVRGFVKVPGFLTGDAAAGVAAKVWERLGRRGIDRHDRTTWPVGRPTKLQGLGRAGVYRPFEERLEPFADQVLGAGRWLRLSPSGPLVSFPEPVPWRLPHKMWHIDLPARGTPEPPIALRLLGLIEPVAARAGGTLLVEGSHELIGRIVTAAGGDAGGSAEVRRALLRRHGWFRRLSSDDGDRDDFFDGTVLDGVTVRVVETTGVAGDAYLVHPWLLHGLAPHAGDGVRSMVTDTLYRTDDRPDRATTG